MLKKVLSLALFLFCYICTAQTVSLIGNVAYLNNTPFNGTVQISLGRTAVNTCSSPVQVVPVTPKVVSVADGVLGTASGFIPTSCLQPSVPYHVLFMDNTGKVVANNDWYVAEEGTTGEMNIGDMVISNFGGPIVVSVPTPILASPSGSQTITQPTGTSLSVNNLVVTSNCSGCGLPLSGGTLTGSLTVPSIEGTGTIETQGQVGSYQTGSGQGPWGSSYMIGAYLDAKSTGSGLDMRRWIGTGTTHDVAWFGQQLNSIEGDYDPCWYIDYGVSTNTQATTLRGCFTATGVQFNSHIVQGTNNEIAGTCSMSSGTSCSFTLAYAYNSTPICIATVQSSTVIAAGCTVSGATVTINAASSNSSLWGAMLIGNNN